MLYEGCDMMLRRLPWCEGMPLRCDCHTNYTRYTISDFSELPIRFEAPCMCTPHTSEGKNVFRRDFVIHRLSALCVVCVFTARALSYYVYIWYGTVYEKHSDLVCIQQYVEYTRKPAVIVFSIARIGDIASVLNRQPKTEIRSVFRVGFSKLKPGLLGSVFRLPQTNETEKPTETDRDFRWKTEQPTEPFLFSVYLRFTINPGRHMVTRALEPLKCCLFSWFHRETHRETEREELFFGFVLFGLKTKNPTETDRHFGETMADRAVCMGESNKRTSWNKVG